MEDYAEENSLKVGTSTGIQLTTTEDSSSKISVRNDVTYAKSWETPTASLLPDGITETPIQQIQDYIQSENNSEIPDYAIGLNYCTISSMPINVFKQIQDYISTENLIGRERELVKDACISAIMQWHEWDKTNYIDLYDHKVEGAEIWAEQYCKKLYKELD
jgi:hypothetical protein